MRRADERRTGRTGRTRGGLGEIKKDMREAIN